MQGRYKKRVPLNAWVIFSNNELFGQGRLLDLTAPGCQIESRQRVFRGGNICKSGYYCLVARRFSQ